MSEENVQFYRICDEGVLMNPITATVEEMQEKPFKEKATGANYIRMVLTQQGGDSKIVALVWGKLYDLVKNKYKEGETYVFPAGTFRTRLRSLEFQSWSNCLCDLIFIKVDNVYFRKFFGKNNPKVEKDVCWRSCTNGAMRESMQDKSDQHTSIFRNSFRRKAHQVVAHSDLDCDWRRR